MLRYFEDMTEPEIAATLGISLGTVKSTVKSTVSRAVAKLRIDAEPGKDYGALSAMFVNDAAGSAGVYCRMPDSWHYQVCRSGARRR